MRAHSKNSLLLIAIALAFWVCASALASVTNLNIRLVGSLKPSTNSLSYGDVWAENDIACLGVWLNFSPSYGVGIISISNPAAPVLLSVYNPSPTSQNQFELGAVRNRIGYFGSWSGGGLHIVSLTNPLPQLLCRVGAPLAMSPTVSTGCIRFGWSATFSTKRRMSPGLSA